MWLKSFSSNTETTETDSIRNHGNVDDDVDEVSSHQVEHVEQRSLSFATITKVGFMKLVKLNFTSISTYTLLMINCVSVGGQGQLRLYLYGDLPCYNWWQMIILSVVLPVLVLFPLSFGISLNMLQKRSISLTTFLVSLVMPYVTLVLYVKEKVAGLRGCNHSEEEERCIDEILLLEEELFWNDDQSVRWPIIQLYRNLLVAALNTFIINTIYRSVLLFPVFLFLSIHDCLRKPFRHMYLNYLQMMTSACLLIINACNNLASFSVVFDLMVVSKMGFILTTLQYLELVLLFIVPLSLPAWKMWEVIRKKRAQKQE